MRVFVTIFLVLAINPLYALDTKWILVKKREGPPSWDCPKNVEMSETKSEIRIVRPPYSDIQMGDLDQGPFCEELSSSYVFGGVRCMQNKRISDGDSVVFENKVCTRESGFFKSCDPENEVPARRVTVEKNQTLVVWELINWVNYPNFACEYSLN